MKKFLKITLFTVLALLAVLLVALLAHPLWLGPAAKWAANKWGPSALKTPMHVGNIELNLYTGKLLVEGCEVQNPTNYVSREAFKMKRLFVDFDTMSAFGDVVRIGTIEIEGVGASCVLEGLTRLDPHLNLLDIKNASDNEKMAAMSDEERKAYIEQKKEENRRKKKEEEELAKSGKQGPGKRVVIKKLSIKDSSVGIGFDGAVAPIPVPSLTIENIGEKPEAEAGKAGNAEEGLTLKNAWNAVWEQIKKAEPAVGAAWNAIAKPVDFIMYGTGDLAGMAADAAKAIGGAVLDAGKGALDAGKGALDAGGKLLKGGGDALKSGAKGLIDGATNMF